jgi:hypothetical protein
VRHEEALADAAAMARLRKKQELDRQNFAARQIQAHVRGMTTRHSLNMTKELLSDIRLKYKAIGRSAGVYRRFVQGLPSDVHLMKIAVKKHHANIKMYTLLKRQMRVGLLWTKLKVLTHEHESLYVSAADLYSVNFTEEHMMQSTLMDATLERVTAEEERLQTAWERKRGKGRGRAQKNDGPRRSLSKSKSRRKGSAAAGGGGQSDWDTEAEGLGLTDYATTDGEELGSHDDEPRRKGKRGGDKVARLSSAVSHISSAGSEQAISAAGSVAGSRAASAGAAAPTTTVGASSGLAESSSFSASPLGVSSAPRTTSMPGKGVLSETPPDRKVKSARVSRCPATSTRRRRRRAIRMLLNTRRVLWRTVRLCTGILHTWRTLGRLPTPRSGRRKLRRRLRRRVRLKMRRKRRTMVLGERSSMQTDDALGQSRLSAAVDAAEEGSTAETRRPPSSERAAGSGGGEAEAAQAEAAGGVVKEAVAEEATTEGAAGSGDVVVPGSPPAAAWEEHGRADRSVPTTPVARVLASDRASPSHSKQQLEELKLAEADSEGVVSENE